MKTRTEKQQEIIDRVWSLLPKMTDSEIDRFLVLGQGMAFMVTRRENANRTATEGRCEHGRA